MHKVLELLKNQNGGKYNISARDAEWNMDLVL